MRTGLIAVLLAAGASLARVQAGVYGTSERPPVLPLHPELFADKVNEAVGILNVQRSKDSGLPPDQPFSKELLKSHKDLEGELNALKAKAKSGLAGVDDRVNLSACQIRLGKYQDAIPLLEPLSREARGNFMVPANLASAHQALGELDRVADYLQQVKDFWPKEAPGFTALQLAWYRKAEDAHLRLARVRRAEAARQPAGARKTPEYVDSLFGPIASPVRFVGESGEYEAGKLAAVEKAKLPAAAVAIVQQLVLWFPEDTRLYWLLGELLNADGQVEHAYKVLDACVYVRRWDSTVLKEHRRILKQALDEQATPPPTPLPDVGKLLLIGGPVAVLILVFGYLQFREIRRRARCQGAD